MKRMARFFCVVLLATICRTAIAQDFLEETVVVTNDAPIEFSRNPRGSLGVDSRGCVHLVYCLPDESSNPPDNKIFYQEIDANIVSSPIRVDSGVLGGGRHASLAVDSSDGVHVVWNDYRHTTSLGNYMDNVEIYYDRKAKDGAFSDVDVRLTETNAGHQGDNGYVPQIAVGPNNNLHVVWYDFTINGNNADIYHIRSGGDGAFSIREGIDSFRITSVEQNPDDYTSNWMPDVAALPEESVYVVWGFLRGWQGAFQLQGMSVAGDDSLSSVETIASKGGRFNDPARLISDREGNLILLSSEYHEGFYRVNLHYKPFDSEWRGPLVVNDENQDAAQPSAAFLAADDVLVVWQEYRGDFNQIVLAQVDPIAMSVLGRKTLSSIECDSITPAIASHPITGKTSVAWIERGFGGDYSIVLRTTGETELPFWRLY